MAISRIAHSSPNALGVMGTSEAIAESACPLCDRFLLVGNVLTPLNGSSQLCLGTPPYPHISPESPWISKISWSWSNCLANRGYRFLLHQGTSPNSDSKSVGPWGTAQHSQEAGISSVQPPGKLVSCKTELETEALGLGVGSRVPHRPSSVARSQWHWLQISSCCVHTY